MAVACADGAVAREVFGDKNVDIFAQNGHEVNVTVAILLQHLLGPQLVELIVVLGDRQIAAGFAALITECNKSAIGCDVLHKLRHGITSVKVQTRHNLLCMRRM
ncbi:MAG: hypothetical protein IPP17_15730 [Bacteroidetes bacterium]|nr:hypothetical protein [Bacteroidota bacterium]